jgi:hypothetical protein
LTLQAQARNLKLNCCTAARILMILSPNDERGFK